MGPPKRRLPFETRTPFLASKQRRWKERRRSRCHAKRSRATIEKDQHAKLSESDGTTHPRRGSSLIVEIGLFQTLTWPVSSKEAQSKLEARVPVKDAAPLGWWDECVDKKLWLKRPLTPSFPADTLGSEEEQVGNNLYFASGVMLRTDRNNQSTVPILGPVSCVMQSSFCRDDLYSQKGVIKSDSVSLEGKLAPFALHLYLEELAIFEEIVDFGEALMEGFSLSSVLDGIMHEVNQHLWWEHLITTTLPCQRDLIR